MYKDYSLLAAALLVVGSLLLAATAGADSSPTTLRIDTDRSKISWVSEAPAEKILGTASDLQGQLRWDIDEPGSLEGKISFPVASMKTGNSMRDKHLQGKDWLNAKENPDITFEIEGLSDIDRTEKDGRIDITATVQGKVTVNGQTAPNNATVEISVLPDKNLVRAKPKLTVRLDDYKVEGRRGTVGKKVAKTIEIEGVLYGNW